MTVEIYTKATCPYCLRAKTLLDGKGVKYIEYPVDHDAATRDKMIARAHGRTTVPQVFIDGEHVGGCDDLLSAEADGSLDKMLAA